MAAAGVAEDPAVQAARILLTLRSRRLLRWPEWVDKEEEPPVAAAVVEVRWPLEGWPKRQRGGRRFRSGWRVDTATQKLGLVAASSGSGGASSSGDERERSPASARWKERPRSRDELAALARRPDSSQAYYVKPAGSGPSTSADRKPRPRHAVVDKVSAAKASAVAAAAAAAMPPREPVMKASSPETPLDFGADAAGSGASSSGDDAARPPSKRRAPGALGSGGGASSGDEGCSSPDKRARVDAGDGDGKKKAISEPKIMQEPKMQAPDDSDKGVKFAFDLNMPCPEDDFC
ncbi:hypothetical protein EJB05_08786 [Eragrostis curvula]|uniref:Uncharacterized protein n=1 Tax=Eragrostis curvula TaxID=38414 RepID=A0A5J9W4E6_9POAL|nr:hypothetical protein EJB05_08786 [Eragrostis curvula]